MIRRGKFITLEGGEGAGKTTQALRLAERLSNAGIPAEYTRSPGGTEIAEQLRNVLKSKNQNEDLLPVSELFLFCACHSQMQKYLLQPKLAAGITVICDRYTDSTTVYQGYARGLDIAKVQELNALAAAGLEPDLTLLLDLAPETGLARSRARSEQFSGDRFDSEQLEFHVRIRKGFLDLAANNLRFQIIDAEKGQDAVSDEIYKAVINEFGMA